jgi:glucose/arabinose dehydrogenase
MVLGKRSARSAIGAGCVAAALAVWASWAPVIHAAQQRGRGAGAPAAGGGGGRGRNSPPLPALPLTFETTEYRIRVSLVAKDLVNPWSVAFLPDGAMLVTERKRRLCIIRNGVLDPAPIAGVPVVKAVALSGVLDVALHPRFAENRVLYLSYSKARDDGLTTTALARAKFDGTALSDVKDIFLANSWSRSSTNYGGRIAFDREGLLYLTIGERQEEERAQTPATTVRSSAFATTAACRRRTRLSARRATARDLFAGAPQSARSRHAAINWPDVEDEHASKAATSRTSFAPVRITAAARDLRHQLRRRKARRALPACGSRAAVCASAWPIAISGLMFYTGDTFPAWKNNVFVGGMFQGRTRGTGQVQRIVLSAKGQPIQREPLLVDLHQRIRDVRQGPDGLVYVLTDEPAGALLKIEPAQ